MEKSMSYLDQIHQREAAEERTVETPKAEETVTETVSTESPKTEETVTETPKTEETVTTTEDKAETEKKPPKDLSGISKEEKAAFAFRRQMAKRESKFAEALKSRDSEIENLKKAISELQAPKEKKSRKDFENDDGYIDYLASQRVDAKWAEKEAQAAEEKAKADREYAEQQEYQARTQESIDNFRTAVNETFTDEAQEAAFKANVAKAYRSGFAELLDAVPPAKSFLLENGTTGVRVLDKILSDREAFGRVFKPNQDPVSMLIELHAIAHEVNQPKAPAVTEPAPKKTAIGRPGQGQGGAPGELHGRDLILHMRKVAQGGRRV
jgi:hypothetical protein